MLNDIRNIYCYHKNFCKDTLFTQQINNLNKFCDKIMEKNAQNQIFADKSAANSGNFRNFMDGAAVSANDGMWCRLCYLV